MEDTTWFEAQHSYVWDSTKTIITNGHENLPQTDKSPQEHQDSANMEPYSWVISTVEWV